MMIAFTDYPIIELGDMPGALVDVREVQILSYDGDKYCSVIVCGVHKDIKAGYLYVERGRCGEARLIDVSQLGISNGV